MNAGKLLLIACAFASIDSLSSNPEAKYYADKFPFIIVRQKPTIHSAELLAVPFGTLLQCSDTDREDEILGYAGRWKFCSNAKGYVFGPLVSAKIPPEQHKLILFNSSEDDHHESGETYFHLSHNIASVQGWKSFSGVLRNMGSPKFAYMAKYSVVDGKLILTSIDSGKPFEQILFWNAQFRAYFQPHLVKRIGEIMDDSGRIKKDWNHDKKQCSFIKLGHRFNYFCIK